MEFYLIYAQDESFRYKKKVETGATNANKREDKDFIGNQDGITQPTTKHKTYPNTSEKVREMYYSL